MAESSLTAAYADVQVEVSRYLGYGRSAPSSGSDDEADINACIKSALRRVYFPNEPKSGLPYRWSWLFAEAEIDTVLPYSGATTAQTVSVTTAGVVTFDNVGVNEWPSWAAQGELLVGGVSYTVATRDSNEQITLDDTSLPAALSTKGFKIGQHRFQLPDDFLHLDSPLTYRSGEAGYLPALEIRNEADIRRWRQSTEYFYYPLGCAVVPRTFDATTGQRWDILLGPTPDRKLKFIYRYLRLPDTIDGTAVYHGGGASLSELVLSASLAEADMKFNDGGTGGYERRFKEDLYAAIHMDRVAHTPNVHGYMMDPDESRDYFSTAGSIYMDYARQLESVNL